MYSIQHLSVGFTQIPRTMRRTVYFFISPGHGAPELRSFARHLFEPNEIEICVRFIHVYIYVCIVVFVLLSEQRNASRRAKLFLTYLPPFCTACSRSVEQYLVCLNLYAAERSMIIVRRLSVHTCDHYDSLIVASRDQSLRNMPLHIWMWHITDIIVLYSPVIIVTELLVCACFLVTLLEQPLLFPPLATFQTLFSTLAKEKRSRIDFVP